MMKPRLWMATLGLAAGLAAASQPLPARDTDLVDVRGMFPQADRVGASTGDPPATPVYGGDRLLGYVFFTNDIAPIPAYSGKPIDVMVGLDPDGVITGARIIEHHEPILLAGISEQALQGFVEQYAGKSVTDRIRVGAGQRPGHVHVDGLTGATVTVMVINEAVTRAARTVLISRDPESEEAEPGDTAPSLRADYFESLDWESLLDTGAVGRLWLTRGEVDDAFVGTAAEGLETAPGDQRDDTFIELYFAYLNLPVIGRNILGDSQYDWLAGELAEGEHAIAIMSRGPYSFKGSGYVRGGIFDRIHLQQHDQGISFRDLDHYRLSDVYADGMPRLPEMGIFIVRQHYDFAPAEPWNLELLVRRQTGPLDSVFLTFAGDYALAEPYVEPIPKIAPIVAVPDLQALLAEQTAEAIWVSVWRDRVFQIVVVGLGLVLLTSILVFQDWLVRRPLLLERLRTGFLVYTVVFIGWYALAQLSVVNVLTFTNALFHDFRWETFLVDPLMFILWSFVAVTLLLWGRGVYCGWLCPYGAAQELINKMARAVHVPQYSFPFAVHERLWAVKYVILLVLFGISLQSLAQAELAAEVEPFKTAVTLRFQREWGFVLYAVGLLAISAVNRKFFCRYLCPLGAALAIPARIRIFDWLKRHNECGSPCQVCAHECEVQAIHPTGQINANECHYCLDCQVTYFNEYKCPPMVARRKRREKATVARESVRELEMGRNTASALDAIPVRVNPKVTQRG